MNYHESWTELFRENEKLISNIFEKIDWNKTVYPSKDNIFRVFKMDIEKIKVIVIGQDPYHQPGQANGLSFSVPKGFKIPPSLRNINKAIDQQLNIEGEMIDDLSFLEEQGVFLLNRSLSVYDSQPNSHSNFGWKTFTENAIKFIEKKRDNVCYLLWGSDAIKLSKLITNECLKSVHPSPLSAYRGFYDNNHFKITSQKYGIKWKM